MLCESSTGIALRFFVYSAAENEYDYQTGSDKSATTAVVRRLMKDFLFAGHHLVMDNYYNSVPLTLEMAGKQTHVTGTLRNTRVGNPKCVTEFNVPPGEAHYAHIENCTVLKYHDKRQVFMVTNRYSPVFVDADDADSDDGDSEEEDADNDVPEDQIEDQAKNQGKRKKKKVPLVIAVYNKYMNGVDKNDQKLSYYTLDLKTIKWYKKVFIRTLHYSIVNIHEMFKIANPGSNISLLNFTLEICHALTGLPATQTKEDTSPTIGTHICTKIPSGDQRGKNLQRKCYACKRRGTFECKYCPKDFSGHFRAFHELCFYKYHYCKMKY